MKRSLIVVAVVCLGLAACGRSRSVSLEEKAAAAAQPPVVVKADSTPEPEPGGTFVFADDGGGKALAKILPPRGTAPLPPDPKKGPKPRKGLAALENPAPPLAAPPSAIPGIGQPKRTPLWPRQVPDAAPLAYLHTDPVVPQRPELPTVVLVRQPSRDVNEPLALAPQAKPAADRASLDDPTTEFSAQRVVAHRPEMRSTPVPFTRMNLPEPFEHRAVTKPLDTEPPVVAPVPALPK